ncbi:unnamed protein product [Cyclocybe aegerita]|uniref:Brain protein I3 n=1 Tax=Cyclocybe aegerita TaxID=1973307 RepID=A0A8S0WBU3_CYCAE|nr:unnamed protein product [Cyclocybe aegerita]
MPAPQAQRQPIPPQSPGQPITMTPPVQAQPMGVPGSMDPTAVAALGQQYRDQLFAQCAIGNHERTTTYGVCGIITAIVCFPCGLICLFTDTEENTVPRPISPDKPRLSRLGRPTIFYNLLMSGKEREAIGMNDQLPPPYVPYGPIVDAPPPQQIPVPTPAQSQEPPMPQAQAPTPPIPPQQQDRPSTMTPPVQTQPTATPGPMDPASLAALGRQYRDQLFAQCAIGNHERTTTYGVCGIVTAIFCFPCGLICLFNDVEEKCARCGVNLEKK